MSRKSPHQASLFDAEPAPVASADLLRIDQGAAALTPAQQTFNRLTEQIGRAREKLASWEALAQRLHERTGSEMHPQIAELGQLQRQLVSQVDALLTHPPAGMRLTRRRRDGLVDFLLERVDDLLAGGDDEELVALHDHYSDISLDERRKIEAGLDRAFAEHLAGEMFGDDEVGDLGADPIDELYRRIDERMASEQREREARAHTRKRSRREAAAEARRAEEAQGARLSVREVYRKLASSLHPDRESDPIERARKTTLMQEINRAYQANDLLTLLRLQMEVEQIDPAKLAALPAQRLAHYNEVLREQLRTLQAEIAEHTERLAQGLGAHRQMRMREPKDAELLFNRQLRELREAQSHWRSLIEALADPYRRLREIDAIARAMADR
jgi:hypothetical protein